MLNCLPDDVLLHIFSYLETRDLSNVSLVCGRFWKLANDRTLWERIDLSTFCISLQRLWKLMRVRFPRTLKGLRIRGYAKAYSGTPRWKTETLSPPLLSEMIARCPQVESLELIELYFSDRTNVEHLPSTLVSLSVAGCQFSSSSAWFTCEKPPPNLCHLDLSQCPGITQKALLVVFQWEKLKSLCLRDCYNITDVTITWLTKGLKNLTRLDIRGTNVSDVALMNIGLHLQDLEELQVGGCAGSHVSTIQNMCISDAGACSVERLQHLAVLNLSNTSITDETLRFLQGNQPSLMQLFVKNTNITLEAVKVLEEKIPSCKVIHQLSENKLTLNSSP